MRFIDINRLESIMGAEKFDEWNNKARLHLRAIESLPKKDRAIYFNQNNIWSELYPYLSELSNHHCWYTEAPEGSSEWEVDHFRPKNKSTNSDGSTILEEGYWWLAYDWTNYRLAGSLANRLRKDRFDENSDKTVYGKGCYFPLDLAGGEVAQSGDSVCSCESPILLDPTVLNDTRLISFDRDGEAFPTFGEEEDSDNYFRAQESIKFYGLLHTPICRARKKIWDKCDLELKKTLRKLSANSNNTVNNKLKRECLTDLINSLVSFSENTEPFSTTVYFFVQEKEQQHPFLKGVTSLLKCNSF